MSFQYILDEITKYYLPNYGTINCSMTHLNFDKYECSYCDSSFKLDEINDKIKLYGLVSLDRKYICCICKVCLNQKIDYLIIDLNYDLDYIKENYKKIFEEFKKYELML